jgi:hypothetical protein
MLEFTACESRPKGRVSCQLVTSPWTVGLVAHLMEIRL